MTNSRRRPSLQRCILAATTLAMALTGGTVGHQLGGADEAPSAAVQPATAGVPTSRPAPHPGSPTGTAAASTATSTTTSTTAGPSTPAPAPATTRPAPAATSAVPVPVPVAAASSAVPAPPPAAGATSAPAPAAAPTDAPFAGVTFYGPNTGAAAAAAAGGRSAADLQALTELAGVPTALWLGSWSGDVAGTVSGTVRAAAASGAVPVFVVYNVPDTDCGGYSAGGATSPAAYAQWVRQVAAGIGTAEAVVVVEPDALAQLCGDPAARYAMLDGAIDTLEANPGTHTYLDAGNPTWIGAQEMAARLRAAGVADADGFAVNVSNFETTASNLSYGRTISAALGGAHFVVDTSRNGNGAGGGWCNPAGRAVGERPTGSTGQAGVDAYLWIKRVGESDGQCNGGPAAGTFWPEYAIGLIRNR